MLIPGGLQNHAPGVDLVFVIGFHLFQFDQIHYYAPRQAGIVDRLFHLLYRTVLLEAGKQDMVMVDPPGKLPN